MRSGRGSAPAGLRAAAMLCFAALSLPSLRSPTARAAPISRPASPSSRRSRRARAIGRSRSRSPAASTPHPVLDDGGGDNAYVVTNDNQRSRFRFVGSRSRCRSSRPASASSSAEVARTPWSSISSTSRASSTPRRHQRIQSGIVRAGSTVVVRRQHLRSHPPHRQFEPHADNTFAKYSEVEDTGSGCSCARRSTAR